MCLAFSGCEIVKALIEFKLLNKKCGCNCCLNLYNSASFAICFASSVCSFIRFCSSWLYQSKLIIDTQLTNKKPIPKRIPFECCNSCKYCTSFFITAVSKSFEINEHAPLIVKLTKNIYQYFSRCGR